jgi:hypothetical protein
MRAYWVEACGERKKQKGRNLSVAAFFVSENGAGNGARLPVLALLALGLQPLDSAYAESSTSHPQAGTRLAPAFEPLFKVQTLRVFSLESSKLKKPPYLAAGRLF